MTAPKTVLVVGAGGVFGSRIAGSLVRTSGLDVVLAGRNLARVEALAARLGQGQGRRVRAACLDARTVAADDMRRLGAFIVVDAAGPFQESGYGLAGAAIAAGAHYVDLADSRAFVAGFARLDAVARAAGVTAVTGASSTPALSNAVLDHLLRGWRRVDAVEIAISPGNRAPRGLSVVRAILSYAGRPVRVLLDGGWAARPGWGMLTRRTIPGLGGRWLSLCETPDLDLVADRFAVRRSVIFRAGLELGLLHLGLAGASLLVRAGIVRSLAPAARLFRSAAGLLSGFGSDCGAMTVEASGIDAEGRAATTVWTLVAEAGDGPSVPTLPALAVVRALAAGRLRRPGAFPCVGLVDLPAIEAEVAGLRIRTEVETRRDEGGSLFEDVLGRDFARMPKPVRDAHACGSWRALKGLAAVDGPEGLLARIAARLFGFPPAAEEVPVRVTIEARDGRETWTRDFGGRRFRSVLSRSPVAQGIEERFGPFAFDLAVPASERGLRMEVLGWRLGRLPLPARLAPTSEASEQVDELGRFRFDVTLRLPRIGRIVRYRGWLVEAGPGRLTEGSGASADRRAALR